jgi:hypothetical protein
LLTDEDWDRFARKEPISLGGYVIPPMGKKAIIGMYDHLKDSKWWTTQKSDTFLSVFFGDVDELGSRVNGKYFGKSAWRVGLQRETGLTDVYEALARFAEPMTGQQKNLLVALITIAQLEPASKEPYVTTMSQFPHFPPVFQIQDYQDIETPRQQAFHEHLKLACDLLQAEEVGTNVLNSQMEKLSLKGSLISRWLYDSRFPHRQSQIQITHSNKQCQRMECFCDFRVSIPCLGSEERVFFRAKGTTQRATIALCREILAYVGEYCDVLEDALVPLVPIFIKSEQVARKARLEKILQIKPQLGDQPPLTETSYYIDIIGSRMGMLSGLWHNDLIDFVSTYYPDLAIRFFDPFEDPSSGVRGGVRYQHIRSFYPGPNRTLIQIDDAQEGPVHVPPTWRKAPYFSEKKLGPYCFGIREYRHFSHIIPSKFSRSYSSCHCLRCKATSYLADVFGGWPVYERLRGMLSKLGGVCEQSSVLGLLQGIVSAKDAYLNKGAPIPAEYLPFVSIRDVPSKLQNLIRGKSGLVMAYIGEFEHAIFSRSAPFDFLVTDSTQPFAEMGLPPMVLTKSANTFFGYDIADRVGEYVVLKKKVDEVKVCYDLKF